MKDRARGKQEFKKKAGYVIGSVVLLVAACVAIPVVMTAAADTLYKATVPKVKDDDDWGPVIEKKEKVDE